MIQELKASSLREPRAPAASAHRNVIVVSPHFPPSTLAGVHRARHLAKHLPAAGWRPTVICVDERFHGETLDPALAELVPASAEVVKTAALPLRLTRPFGVGDIGIRGYGGLRAAIAEQIASIRPDAVLITGSPFYPMLLAPWIQRRFGVPVALDFQDPWVSAWGATTKPMTKVWAAHQLARRLEPAALRGASFVTSVSDRQNDEMAARYPWLDASRMAAIPIGGDPEDFDALRQRPPSSSVHLEAGRLNFCYVGTLLPRAGGPVRAVFKALATLRRAEPQLAERMRMHFVGTSNSPNAGAAPRVMPLAEAEGVADLVHETPQRAPFLEALSVLANAHALLLIGSDEAHYTASKIYPGLMSGRPYLSLFHSASSSHAILSTAAGGRSLGFASEAELDALQPALVEALRALAAEAHSFGPADAASYADYEAAAVARRFAQVFDRMCAKDV